MGSHCGEAVEIRVTNSNIVQAPKTKIETYFIHVSSTSKVYLLDRAWKIYSIYTYQQCMVGSHCGEAVEGDSSDQ